MSNAAQPGFLPGKLGRGAVVLMLATNFKSCVLAGQAGKGRKSRRAVSYSKFLEQKTPYQKIKIGAKLLFAAPLRQHAAKAIERSDRANESDASVGFVF